jgi:hypothetical protein
LAKPAADSRDLLVRGAAQLGLAMDAAGVERLLAYLAELMKWSRRVNLIARAEGLAGIDRLASGPWRVEAERRFVLPFSGAPRLVAAVVAA